MKRRNRVVLMWVLTGIWLCVQSPWAQSQRVQAQAQAQAQAHAVQQAAEHCHGEAQPPASAPSAGCCVDGHCDAQCVQLSFALAATAPHLLARGVVRFVPVQVAGVQSMRQPELFRPPI